MPTLAELYFAAVLSGADGSAEGLGSVNLLRWELCAGGSKGGFWGYLVGDCFLMGVSILVPWRYIRVEPYQSLL